MREWLGEQIRPYIRLVEAVDGICIPSFNFELSSLTGGQINFGLDFGDGDGQEIVVIGKRTQQQCSAGVGQQYSTADAARDVGEFSSAAGGVLEITGAVVGVFLPPAGGVIGGVGFGLNAAGTVLTAGADLSEDRNGAFVGDVASLAIGLGAERAAARFGGGALRAANGQFARNPLGGAFRKAKGIAIGQAAEQFSSAVANVIACPQ